MLNTANTEKFSNIKHRRVMLHILWIFKLILQFCRIFTSKMKHFQFPLFNFISSIQWSLMWMDKHKINITIPASVQTFNSLASPVGLEFYIFFSRSRSWSSSVQLRLWWPGILLFKQETWIHNLNFYIYISILLFKIIFIFLSGKCPDSCEKNNKPRENMIRQSVSNKWHEVFK